MVSETFARYDVASNLFALCERLPGCRAWSQNMRGGMKKQKLDKEKDRDISEKIALGMHKGTGAKGGADL